MITSKFITDICEKVAGKKFYFYPNKLLAQTSDNVFAFGTHGPATIFGTGESSNKT